MEYKRGIDINFKRGQISIFVILGILIVGIIVVVFIFNKDGFNNNVNPEIDPIHSYVQNCLQLTGEDAIDFTSRRGGYYELPEFTTELAIPYYIYNKKSYMPSKEKIEEQISLYINDNLNLCVDFNEFEEFNIEPGIIVSSSDIKEGVVILKVKYPLSISKGENSYVLENFKQEIDVRLNEVYDAVDNIELNEINSLNGICISCIEDISAEFNIEVSSFNYDDNTIIYSVRDENSYINGEVFIFNFANQYDW